MSMANINDIKSLLSDSSEAGSDQERLRAIIEEAENLVNRSFGDEEGVNFEGNKFYNFAFNLINNEFDTFIKSIENIRSSYLPSDVVYNALGMGRDTTSSIKEISNQSTPLESYQNAFFRMLGLPSWEDVYQNSRDTTLSIVDGHGNLINNIVNEINIYNDFLDKRQAFSTVGCAAGIRDYDLISPYKVSTDDLKQIYKFPEEAISLIVDFSNLLNHFKEADVGSDEYKDFKKAFIDNALSFSSKKTNDNKTLLLDNVKKNGSKDSGDPFLFFNNAQVISRTDDIDKDQEYYLNDSTTQSNYFSFLLFIFYAYVGSDVSSFLTQQSLNKIYKELVLKQATDESLNNIEENIYTYSSLLFPMVKDGRISRCINDPEKIVADPFTPITKRMVNGKFLKSSLLESIIRIRTDVISGTLSYDPSESMPYTIGDDGRSVEKRTVSGEFLGYLESLLIIRMLESLETLAEGTKKNIYEIAKTQRKTGRGLFGSCSDPTTATAAIPTVPRKPSPEKVLLNNYALIEDSILLLLGTKDIDQDSLSLQVGINRDSSVPNSYLMSSLVNIVQVPRKYIKTRIEEIDRKADTQNSVGSKSTKDLEVAIGIRSGVGVVDFLAIVIALLTIEEKYLIGLLTTEQRNLMYNQVNKDTFDDERRAEISMVSIDTAVNMLTERVYNIYQLFVELLKN